MTIQNDYLEGTAQQLGLWGREFERLDQRLTGSPEPPGAAELRRRLSALKRRKRWLERRLREAAHTTRVEWEQVRVELESAVRAFRDLATKVYDRTREV